MKTKTMLMVTMAGLLVAMTTGCDILMGPQRYRSQKQYDDGKWRGVADNRQVNQRSLDRLAIEKLRAQPVTVGLLTPTGVVTTVISPVPGKTVALGYMGIIQNFSTSQRYRIEVDGPQRKIFNIGPGARVVEYLLPGTYLVTSRNSSGYSLMRPYLLYVGPEEEDHYGQKCHWSIDPARRR